MYTEIKRANKWCSCDLFLPSGDYDGEKHAKYSLVPLYDNRNYSLFATLADVRNYDDTEYICEPKGFPKNASTYVEREYDSWGFDAHSCSYLTLRELIEYQERHHTVKHKGMLSPEQLEDFDKGILPERWCRWCTGPNYNGYELREWGVRVRIIPRLELGIEMVGLLGCTVLMSLL
jgi:hypothetical protein